MTASTTKSGKATARLSNAEYRELELLRLEKKYREGLPHRHGFPWYDWAWKFYTSRNRFNFLCAANQISKSSTQIRKCIQWATDDKIWDILWQTTPRQFIYLYPTKPVATTEFNEKWEPEFLPRGEFKKHPKFGWESEIKNKELWALHFNSGVSVYFKTYAQDVQDLQTSTAHAVFCDEELPYPLFQELRSRLIATNGYFHMVFTATLGQDEWRRTMEPANESEELFKDALKIQVSMYECLKYRDGTPSPWTVERIKEVEAMCATEAEVQKRVYGRFVVSSGLKIQGFARSRNVVKPFKIPSDWAVYTGVDPGSGGEKGHPAAIAFVAVRPDHKLGVVFRGWRGDGVVTSSADILEKHTELATSEFAGSDGALTKRMMNLTLKSYDWQAKDFQIVASRAGEGFTPADKRRDAGFGVLNTLFKLGMLVVFDDDPELAKLVVELTSLQEDTPKQRARDDLVDALRYAVQPVSWNFEGVAGEIFKVEEQDVDDRSEAQKAFDERRSARTFPEGEEFRDVESELDEWQGLIDG